MKKILFITSLFLAGCEPVIDSRGYDGDRVDTKKIVIGKTTKNEVSELLGSPSVTSAYVKQNQKWESWIYISKKMSTTSFFKPETLSQKNMTIIFDEKEIVRDFKTTDGSESKTLEADCDKTDTTGYEQSLGKGVFGNFGRMLNKSPKEKKK